MVHLRLLRVFEIAQAGREMKEGNEEFLANTKRKKSYNISTFLTSSIALRKVALIEQYLPSLSTTARRTASGLISCPLIL
jgi:hypothetical protein